MSKRSWFSSELISNGSWITEFYCCHYGFWTCCKVYNSVSAHPKSMKLGQITNLNMIFHAVVSVYRLVKIWISPSSLLNFGMARSFIVTRPPNNVARGMDTSSPVNRRLCTFSWQLSTSIQFDFTKLKFSLINNPFYNLSLTLFGFQLPLFKSYSATIFAGVFSSDSKQSISVLDKVK